MVAKQGNGKRQLRSKAWFDNPDNADMTALYLERYLNYGLTREELQSGKPIIGMRTATHAGAIGYVSAQAETADVRVLKVAP